MSDANHSRRRRRARDRHRGRGLTWALSVVAAGTLACAAHADATAADRNEARPDDPGDRTAVTIGSTRAAGDSLSVYTVDRIVIERANAASGSAVPVTNLDGEAIDRYSYGQDLPMVLSSVPSVYAWSDAGNGFGYTYLRIRGFYQDRLGILVNGVPLNDPEAHQVYWVDHGDILASASQVQVQRGVGTNLFGASSFGGSVNVLTSPTSIEPGVHLATGYGTFTDADITSPTRAFRAIVASGPVLEGRAAFSARYSRQRSGGYRRASDADLESVALSALYRSGSVSHKVDVLSGSEVTRFAWDGLPRDVLSDRDARRDNVYDVYDNNVDDFRQTITSITTDVEVGDGISLSNTAYYVDGEGFYEQYQTDEPFFDYGFAPIDVDGETVDTTDLVRRRWLDNFYWGMLPQARLPLAGGDLTVGLGLRRYESDHFGEVVWTDQNVDAEALDRYYDYDTSKTSVEAYARLAQRLGSRTRVTGAIQYQGHRYDVDQTAIKNFRGYEFSADHDFVSPRLGVRHRLDGGLSVFGSVSLARREPSSSDYMDEDDPSAVPAYADVSDDVITGLDDPIVDPEKVLDLELGAEVVRESWNASVTLYDLEFRGELIPIDGGRIQEEGRLARANADRTRHQGLEIAARVEPRDDVLVGGNVTFARHRYVDHEIFAYWLDDYAGGLLRLDGNTVPRNPEILGNLYAEVRRGAWTFGAQAQHVGKQYVESENVESLAIDAFTLVNTTIGVNLGRALDLGRPFELELRVINVFDTLHETFGYAYYDGSPPAPEAFYWPGATRSVFLGLETRL